MMKCLCFPNKKMEADFKITLWTEVQSYKCMASMVGCDKTLVSYHLANDVITSGACRGRFNNAP